MKYHKFIKRSIVLVLMSMIVFTVTTVKLHNASRTIQIEAAQSDSAAVSTTDESVLATTPSSEDALFVDKDETVYASLDGNGGIKSLTVVNLLRSTKPSGMLEFVDYADYSQILSLSENVEPTITGNKVVFTLSEPQNTFYYRGNPTNQTIPFRFDIRYLLNGVETAPSAMAGKSGAVTIDLTVMPNKDAFPYYLDNFMCQIQMPLSLDIFSNITAPGGQAIIAGSNATYSFTILPSQQKTFQVKADVSLFEVAPLSIVCIPFNLSEFAGPDTNISKDDFAALLDGADQLAKGANSLKDGMGKLSDTLSLLFKSAGEIAANQSKLDVGLSSFADGVTALSAGIEQFNQGLTATATGGQELNDGFTLLHQNLSLFLSQLQPLTAGLPAEQQTAFQYQISAIETGLDDFSDSLTQYVNAVTAVSQASAQINIGMQKATAGGQTLKTGFNALTVGTKAFAEGMGKLAPGGVALVKGASEVAAGQSTFAFELRQSLGLFNALILPADSSRPVSFANAALAVRSVQFVISTPEIRLATADPLAEEIEPVQSFWQKFIHLFDWIFVK